MKKRVLFAAAMTALVLLVFAIPALAAVSQYTAVGFKYIGDVFHEKEVTFSGGSINFQVSGVGDVSGNHSVRTSASAAVYEGDPAYETVNLAARFEGTTALDAAEGEYMRILSTVDLRNRALVQTGVEMNPGESGYIRQWASSTTGSDGDYLKVTNHFGNTGGTTKRNTEVKGFMTDTMRVDGYAEVWETTTRRSGTARTGFYDLN